MVAKFKLPLYVWPVIFRQEERCVDFLVIVQTTAVHAVILNSSLVCLERMIIQVSIESHGLLVQILDIGAMLGKF